MWLQPARASTAKPMISNLTSDIRKNLSPAAAQRRSECKNPQRRCAAARESSLKTHLHSELKLPRIECGGRLPKPRQRLDARAERVVRHSQIRMVQDIEAFSQQLQVDSLRQLDLSTKTQIQRGEIKPPPRIAPNANGPIVEVRIEVAIASQQHVERQTRRVREYVTHLKTTQEALEPRGF